MPSVICQAILCKDSVCYTSSGISQHQFSVCVTEPILKDQILHGGFTFLSLECASLQCRSPVGINSPAPAASSQPVVSIPRRQFESSNFYFIDSSASGWGAVMGWYNWCCSLCFDRMFRDHHDYNMIYSKYDRLVWEKTIEKVTQEKKGEEKESEKIHILAKWIFDSWMVIIVLLMGNRVTTQWLKLCSFGLVETNNIETNLWQPKQIKHFMHWWLCYTRTLVTSTHLTH